MFRTKASPGRRVGFIQLDAGDHPTTAPEEIKRHGNHRAGLNLKGRIEKLAVARIFPDLILKERLLAGEDHANDTSLQWLFEFAHKLPGVRARIPGRDKKFARLIQKPNSAFIRACFSEAVFNRLAHQGIKHRSELLRVNACGNSLEPLRKSGPQIQKRWVRKDV
jgi:hypothetical protein